MSASAGPARDHQDGPPRRSKVLATLAVLACAGCCALPLLVPLGLGAAGVAAATTGLLVVAAVLFALAGLLWFLRHRATRRRAAHDCAGGSCPC